MAKDATGLSGGLLAAILKLLVLLVGLLDVLPLRLRFLLSLTMRIFFFLLFAISRGLFAGTLISD